jgi:three-Cys-motif partner protein
MNIQDGIIVIKEHSKKKYNILKKYWNVCSKFGDKYKNFIYIDTHGGSGRIILPDGKTQDDGSVLIARKANPNFPCYVIEIDAEIFSRLFEFTKEFTNIKTICGDCNEKIDEILKEIPREKKFIFCFLDPEGLVYKNICHQLLCETVEKIADFPRTEILLNIPLEAIIRSGSFVSEPSKVGADKNIDNVTKFFGKNCNPDCKLKLECKDIGKECNKWKEIIEKETVIDKKIRKLLELYIAKNLNKFPYVGAILIRNENNFPQYYLVYGTKNYIGAKIMREIMEKEWGKGTLGDFDKLFPINKFIFE